jgi:excinuclease UvrABC nuclease subunit
MGKKSADLKPEAIETLAQDKPVVYRVLNRRGENIYTGSAKRGQVADRIKDHLPLGSHPIPGAVKVEIEQHSSIREAEVSEPRIISRAKPRYNKQGK